MDTEKQTEIKWEPNRKLTYRQNAFVKEKLADPRISATEAAMRSHDLKNRDVAKNVAYNLMHNEKVINELNKYSSLAEENLILLAGVTTKFAQQGDKAGAAYAAVAERVNNSILDRIHGKATQKIEQASVAVQINVDLSGAA